MSSSRRDQENSSKLKQGIINSAMLGMSSHHGMKFSLNMTSQNKKELMLKLEEWRKKRREKLVASILAKQKPTEKPKGLSAPSSQKTNFVNSVKPDGAGKKSQTRETVFDRLYKNSSKTKKEKMREETTKSKLLGNKISKNESKISPDEGHFNSDELPSVEPNQTILNESPANVTSKEEIQQAEESTYKNKEKNLENSNEISSVITADVEINLEKLETANHAEIICQKDFIREENLEENEKEIKSTLCMANRAENYENSSNMIFNSLECKEEKNSVAVKTTSCFPNKNLPKMQNLPVLNNMETNHYEPPGKPLRRSISMVFRAKKKTGVPVCRAFSEQNLCKNTTEKSFFAQSIGKKTAQINLTPVVTTPKPNSKMLTAATLRNRLEDWLNINGHSLEGYRHLRCFGIKESLPISKTAHQSSTTPNENNVPDSAFEDSDKENDTPSPVNQKEEEADVENWLKELYRLIVQLKYPAERCEEWLIAIRKKCSSCTQFPIYWECMAALDESKGKMESALEHYQKALINGGNPDLFGDSLTQLFDKMVIEQKKPSKCKLEKGLDPKNIFKSTTIKFALQEKNSKEPREEKAGATKHQLYVATPVRRSSRIQTPSKTLVVSSLQTLNPELQKSITFKPNESLMGGN